MMVSVLDYYCILNVFIFVGLSNIAKSIKLGDEFDELKYLEGRTLYQQKMSSCDSLHSNAKNL